MASPSKEELAQAVAYRDTILTKIESNQSLTCSEKRFLLRTGSLPYKALAFPESITPAQRNRIRYSPPPDIVKANIIKVTDGQLSTPEELYAKVLRDPGSLGPEELTLIVRNMFLPGSTHEALARRRWQNKTSGSKAWNMAFNRVTTEQEAEAHRAAAREEMRPEREEEKRRDYLEKVGKLETSEERESYHARERMMAEQAGERLKEWEEYDKILEKEVKAEMKRMADEMPQGECDCCAGLQEAK
ncbi:hypothetical protein QBC47DRAFT_395235 [Echria macrotheca]|uniref:Uncharacterized protein n=1 Tax=Echria macrotheca TaxID=438768 RepID=A0AAJ0B1M7_9PEZI|nr:hypothetical protein QBC47DRAFT_395235 [Echria macrotheca]